MSCRPFRLGGERVEKGIGLAHDVAGVLFAAKDRA